MNGPPHHGGDVALFIDWENFKISLATGHRTPNVSALREEVSNHGRVVVAKAYADWVTRAPELRGASQFIIDPPALYAAGIEPVYVPTRLPPGAGSGFSDSTRTVRVKNSVDVKMTADCIECAHTYANINTFVLVSGDSDFIHVINALRAMGKRVVIIGVSTATSRRLSDQVDALILYDVDVDPVTPAEAPAPAANGRQAPKSSNAKQRDLPEVIRAIEDVVRTERQAGRTPLLTSLKQRLMRRFPGFDEKKLGFSGFKKLVLRSAQEGNIKLVTVGLVDWVIMADEPDPQESVSEEQTVSSTQTSAEDTSSDSGGEEPETVQGEVVEAEIPEPVVDGNGHKALDQEAAPEAATPDQPVTRPGEIDTVAAETVAGLKDWPEGPDDGHNASRAVDLIIMADTLESREGVSHVAFNFLVAEVSQALSEGLEAEHEEITQRWGEVYSRAYVTKAVRSLGEANVFRRGWQSIKDESTGRSRRVRTFLLNREHPLVQLVVASYWGGELPESRNGGSPDSAEAATAGVTYPGSG